MNEENYNEKDVAFYSATLAAWYTTRFEKDKHLLSLSSAGIGLLVTLVTTVGTSTFCTAAMYILAVLSFLVCVMTVLAVFGRNSKHLEGLVAETEENDSVLSMLDKLASFSFIFGIIFTLLVGFFSGIENFNQEGNTMAKDTENRVVTGKSTLKKSVDGAARLKPSKPAEKPQSGQGNQTGGSSSSDKK